MNARQTILQRRSALGFDARSSLPVARFQSMLRRLDPVHPPFDVIDWAPQIHLALFVHRVDGLLPGLYTYIRSPDAEAPLRAAMHPDFLWERVHASNVSNVSNVSNDLFLLVPTDERLAGNRLTCQQVRARAGNFSEGVLARG
jgi:hypothetical protein